ncbi:MAG: magnesium/cobalt transporter CorA [Saprospiraceae bacterium]|nr:magnesium/cobalt transporter CorA [Saprospiraceae bacterium]
MSKRRKQRKIIKKGLSPGTLVYTGEWAETPLSVVTTWWTEEDYLEKPLFSPELHEKAGVTWTDIRGLNDTNFIAAVGERFDIHPLALEDILDTQQRSKLEEYDDSLFFIIHNLRLEVEAMELASEQISIFLTRNDVLSFQEDPDDTFAGVRKRAVEKLGRLRKKGVDYLVYALIDTVVDGYYEVMNDLEGQIFEVEEMLYQLNTIAPIDIKTKVFHLKRVVNDLRRRVTPLREASTRLLRSESGLIDEANRIYFRDVVDHVAQILDALDNQREALSSLETYMQAEASNRLNNVMRLLTVISTIFIPLSFVAGVYGMNFDNMPELHWKYGYFYVLGIMLLSSLFMLAYFRKKRWI